MSEYISGVRDVLVRELRGGEPGGPVPRTASLRPRFRWWVCASRLVLRRKSWVMAIPMLAKAREVRSQARKVRSSARWSLATEPLFSREMER